LLLFQHMASNALRHVGQIELCDNELDQKIVCKMVSSPPQDRHVERQQEYHVELHFLPTIVDGLHLHLSNLRDLCSAVEINFCENEVAFSLNFLMTEAINVQS
jgi:hypothetical protein